MQRGIRRGIVTGKGRGTAEISMRALGLSPYIEALETGSEVGADKPESIRRMLERWDISAKEAAYVGDMPYDMQAAREVGLLPLGAAWAKTATVKAGDGAVELFTSVAAFTEWIEDTILSEEDSTA
jgi:pyrophosphatase PpaX